MFVSRVSSVNFDLPFDRIGSSLMGTGEDANSSEVYRAKRKVYFAFACWDHLYIALYDGINRVISEFDKRRNKRFSSERRYVGL